MTTNGYGRDHDGAHRAPVLSAAGHLRVLTAPATGDDLVRLVVTGEVDRETAPLLHACLGTHLRPGGCSLILVDLTDVPFLNVAGLRTLALAHRQATDSGQRLVVLPGDRYRGPRRALLASGLLELLTEPPLAADAPPPSSSSDRDSAVDRDECVVLGSRASG